MVVYALAACSIAAANDSAAWWNPGWNLRTSVTRPMPYRDDAPRPVEVAVDLPLLMERAGIDGQFDPASLRVIEPSAEGPGRQVPFAYRTEFNAPEGRRGRRL